jgi:hypothetical protein
MSKSYSRRDSRRGYAAWKRWMKQHPESGVTSVARYCGGWVMGTATRSARQIVREDQALIARLKHERKV